MDNLVIENEKLIYYILRQYKLNEEDYYDLGMIGLVKASKSYTESKGKFSTYACECIKHEILKDIQLQKCKKRTATVVSLDDLINGTEDLLLIESIPADINIEEEIIKKEKIKRINQALLNLSPIEQKIIKENYGINTRKKSVRELTEKLNMSTEEINLIKRNAMKKMRKELRIWKIKY